MLTYKMRQLEQTVIVICIIAVAILLFYIAYCMCKKYATEPDSYEMQDYIAQPSPNIFKEKFLFIHMCYDIRKYLRYPKSKFHAMFFIFICVIVHSNPA